jgi:hypothetical protein
MTQINVTCGGLLMVALLAVGCQQPAATEKAKVAEPASTPAIWPDSLTPALGGGYPNSNDPCRSIGETPLTNNYLSDSAILVGCLTKADADKLGGEQVGVVDGVIMVSIRQR